MCNVNYLCLSFADDNSWSLVGISKTTMNNAQQSTGMADVDVMIEEQLNDFDLRSN